MRGVVRKAWLALAGLALLLALAVNAAPMILLLDSVRQLAPQAAVAALAIAAVALLANAPRGAAMFGFAAVLFALPAASVATPQSARPGAPTISLYLLNTHSGRADPSVIESQVLAANPDIVVLVESWPEQTRRLRRLREAYRFQFQQPGHSQIAVFSRLPVRLADPQPEPWPIAQYLDLTTRNGDIRLASVHLARPWPFSHPGFQRTEIARLINNLRDGDALAVTRPTILVGDFNAAPWGQAGATLRRAGLSPAGGLEGTWPSMAPAFLRVPIDNAYVAGGVTAVGKQVLARTGSDHLPVLFRFQPPAQR